MTILDECMVKCYSATTGPMHEDDSCDNLNAFDWLPYGG